MAIMQQKADYFDSLVDRKPYFKYVPDLYKLKEFEQNGKANVQTLITPKGKETLRLLIHRAVS